MACLEPFVSIIVLNWNGLDFLEKCLQSLVCLDYANYEIIVVDNDSNDGSPEIVTKHFPDVKLIVNKRNLGFAGGNNVGIRASKGDLIALVNNDISVDRKWLRELVTVAVSSERIGIVSGIVLQGGLARARNIVWEAGKHADPLTGSSWRLGFGESAEQVAKACVTDDIDFFSACAVLIKKQVIAKIGLLDEGYFLYGEDEDWSFCARRAGFTCELAPSALSWHEGSASRKKVPLIGYYLFSQSAFILIFKQYPVASWFTTTFFRMIVLSVAEVLLYHRSKNYIQLRLASLAHVLLDFGEIMTARKRIKSIGKLHARIRFAEFLRIAKQSANQRANPNEGRELL